MLKTAYRGTKRIMEAARGSWDLPCGIALWQRGLSGPTILPSQEVKPLLSQEAGQVILRHS